MRKLLYLLIVILLVGCTSDEMEYSEKQSELKSGAIEKALGDFYLMVNPQSRGDASDFKLKVKSINKLVRNVCVSRSGSSDDRYIVAFDIAEKEGFAVMSMNKANTDVLFFTENGNVDDISNIDALGSIVGNIIVMPGITIPDTVVKDDNPPQSELLFHIDDVKLSYRQPIKEHVNPGWPHNVYNETCSCGKEGENGHKLNYSVSIAFRQALEYHRPAKDSYPDWYGDGTVSPFPNISVKDALIASDMSRINKYFSEYRTNPCDMLDRFGINFFECLINYGNIFTMNNDCLIRFIWSSKPSGVNNDHEYSMDNIPSLIRHCDTYNSSLIVLQDIPNFYFNTYGKTVGWNIDGFIELKNGAKYYYCDWCSGTGRSNGWIHLNALKALENEVVFLIPEDAHQSSC